MPDALVHTVTAAGVGVPYAPLEGGSATVPASRTGIAHFRNRGREDATLRVSLAGPFGPMDAEIDVPAGADRLVALSDRLTTPGQRTITFTLAAGDVDVAFFDRDILDRA